MKKMLSLLLFFGMLSAFFCGCSAEEKISVPERVSLLLESENRIIMSDYVEYIAGCIFSAADLSYKDETLIAVGIACSGRAVRCLEENSTDFCGADFSSDSDECPEWISLEQAAELYGAEYDENIDRVKAAAGIAAALCPVYDGKPANTLYCGLSSGFTDSGGEDYLPSLELSCDLESSLQKSQAILTADIVRAELKGVIGSVVLPPDKGEWFTDAVYTEHGTLVSICFGGKMIMGGQLTKALGLRGVCVEIEQAYNDFTFKVSGSGGNQGMSVYAAERLARAGKSAEEIIQYFYPGVSLKEVCLTP